MVDASGMPHSPAGSPPGAAPAHVGSPPGSGAAAAGPVDAAAHSAALAALPPHLLDEKKDKHAHNAVELTQVTNQVAESHFLFLETQIQRTSIQNELQANGWSKKKATLVVVGAIAAIVATAAIAIMVFSTGGLALGPILALAISSGIGIPAGVTLLTDSRERTFTFNAKLHSLEDLEQILLEEEMANAPKNVQDSLRTQNALAIAKRFPDPEERKTEEARLANLKKDYAAKEFAKFSQQYVSRAPGATRSNEQLLDLFRLFRASRAMSAYKTADESSVAKKVKDEEKDKALGRLTAIVNERKDARGTQVDALSAKGEFEAMERSYLSHHDMLTIEGAAKLHAEMKAAADKAAADKIVADKAAAEKAAADKAAADKLAADRLDSMRVGATPPASSSLAPPPPPGAAPASPPSPAPAAAASASPPPPASGAAATPVAASPASPPSPAPAAAAPPVPPPAASPSPAPPPITDDENKLKRNAAGNIVPPGQKGDELD